MQEAMACPNFKATKGKAIPGFSSVLVFRDRYKGRPVTKNAPKIRVKIQAR